MTQVKKSEVRNSILLAAFSLFSEKGYQATSMPVIASMAGITPGNIYRYYKSKFELFYDVLEPWLDDQLTQLEKDVADLTGDREKLNKILVFMWVELPRAGNNFEINLMEALATKKPDEPYSRELLQNSEKRIGLLIDAILPSRTKALFPAENISHLIFMCHDGFVLNARLADDSYDVQQTINRIEYLVFGPN
jgi:AcrR family transcriptional regulator